MSLEANKFRIGLFFSIGFLLFIIGVVWLAGGFREKAVETYVSYFGWSVQGLSSGSNVMYNGVPIGRVSDICVAPDDRLVQVVMEISASFNVDSTIIAKMQIVGITGLKLINLSSSTSDSPGKWGEQDLSFKPPHQVIPVEAGAMESVETGLERMIQILNDTDFKEISNQSVLLLQNMNRLLDAETVDTLLVSLNSNSRRLDSLLTTYDRLGRSLLELSNTLNREAPELADDIHMLAEQISGLSDPIDFMVTGLDELVIESGQLLRDLRNLVDLLKNNPAEFLMPAAGEDIWQ